MAFRLIESVVGAFFENVKRSCRDEMALIVGGDETPGPRIDAEVGLAEAPGENGRGGAVGRDLDDGAIVMTVVGLDLAPFGQVEATVRLEDHVHGKFAGLGRLTEGAAEVAVEINFPIPVQIDQAFDSIFGKDEDFTLAKTQALGFMDSGSNATPLKRLQSLGDSGKNPDIAIESDECGPPVGEEVDVAKANVPPPRIGEWKREIIDDITGVVFLSE
ncbi:MAG: hypothetical protein AAF514_04405 [Verrucomicrobiota bacterium]